MCRRAARAGHSKRAITRLNAALEGRYRIESEIGEGGMATVYLAEIKTTANLTQPHILTLFDSGDADLV